MFELGLKHAVKAFRDGSVFVVGRKGTGKDVLMGNVVVRRKSDYIGNNPYTTKYAMYPFDINDFVLPATYDEFLADDVGYYEFPYPEGTDIYLSDVGCYFPNFATLTLNKKYEGFVYFMMLSRQLGRCNVHLNTQAYGRVYDKIREQASFYILTKKCRWLKNLCPPLLGRIPFLRDVCLMTYVIYERASSIETEAIEFRVKHPRRRLLRGGAHDETADQIWQNAKDQHETQYGKVTKVHSLFRNLSEHDTHYFKEVFKNGKK